MDELRNINQVNCDEPRPPRFGRRRIEIVSTGIDDSLQGLSGNPYSGGNIYWAGLRVPGFVNTSTTRYLMMMASFTIGDGGSARLIGMRQAWTLGFRQVNPIRVVEQLVTDPFFKLVDGNISWHLRRMPPNYPALPTGTKLPVTVAAPTQVPVQNMAWRQSDSPALLFQTASLPLAAGGFYTGLTAYTPPNAGMPWGDPLTTELGTFYDLKVPTPDSRGWSNLDIPIAGPCRVQLFASVLQSNPATRAALTVPNPFTASNGLSAEEQFLQNFANAIIWRVHGGLVYMLDTTNDGDE